MSRPIPALSLPAPRRPVLLRALVWLALLGGLLWSVSAAQARPAHSELTHFLPELSTGLELAPEAVWLVDLDCRKLVPLKTTPAELLLHEVDQALLRWQLCRLLKQAPPPGDALPSLPEIGPQPLLRPPTALA